MGAQAKQSDDMSRHRAILTDRERELIANAADDEKEYQYQAVSRIRNKIHDELTEDVNYSRSIIPIYSRSCAISSGRSVVKMSDETPVNVIDRVEGIRAIREEGTLTGMPAEEAV